MAPPPASKTKVLERCRVAPAPGSAAPATLPLTFFDYIFLRFHPVERVFFYELPGCSRSRFLRDHLPHLKLSLSLALRVFRPLAGTLFLLPHPAHPELRCHDDDAVTFTVAESGDDFADLSGDHPRDVARFHPLVPTLPPGGACRRPVLALQVTVFPDAGVALGVAVQHAVADGSTSAHFLKTWAAMCRLGRKGVAVVGEPPSYDRGVVVGDGRLGRIFLDDLEALKEDRGLEGWDLTGRTDVVRATFVVTREQIQRLGEAVYRKTPWEYCSPYALGSGLTWACLVKARGGDVVGKSTSTEYFGFVTGCRARLDPPAPATYFGNCLGICRVEVRRSELVGEGGVVAASAAIWKVIKGLEEGAMRGAEGWIRDIYWLAGMGVVTVAGSPKLGLYELDVGWGRPSKIEVVSIERTSAISIAEGRMEGGGGLEFGLALPRDQMCRFGALFADGLLQLSSSSSSSSSSS